MMQHGCFALFVCCFFFRVGLNQITHFHSDLFLIVRSPIAVNCGHPGRPRHGNISESGFTYQKKVTFYCNRHYELDGQKERYCQADGKWSGEQPKCVPSK